MYTIIRQIIQYMIKTAALSENLSSKQITCTMLIKLCW